MKIMDYAYFKGHIKPYRDVSVPLACNSLQYGTTCFGGVRGYVKEGRIQVFRLKDHYQRLMNASKILGFNYHITYEGFETVIQEMILKNRPESDFYIRPFLFSDDEVLAPKPKGLHFDLAIYFVPLGHYFDPGQGLKLMISSWRKFPDSSMPTKAKAGGCYVNSFLATQEAMFSGYDEALLTDQEGYIVEASVANLLMRYRDRVLMPELGSAQLEGVTMRSAIALLEDAGIQVEFGRIDRSMIYTCDELILMGTAAQFSFAHSVDARQIGSGTEGKLCRLLRHRFHEVLENRSKRSSEWLTYFNYQEVHHEVL